MLRTSRLNARGIAISALLGLGTSVLAFGCVSTPKKDKAKTEAKAAKNLVLDALPTDAKKLDVNFDDKLALVGYKLDAKGEIKPGDKVTLTMHPLKNGSPGGSLVRVKVPDGRTLGPGATN